MGRQASYVTLRQINIGTEESPYLRYIYKIDAISEFMNISINTLRKYIKEGFIPETPLKKPAKNPRSHIIATRVYVWEQFEALHVATLKFQANGTFPKNHKRKIYSFILNEWMKIPCFAGFKRADFVYTPLKR
jgi:hypothetical protein